MSGVRWTTALGIAFGGAVGALAALLGAPKAAPTARPSGATIPERPKALDAAPPAATAAESIVAAATGSSARAGAPHADGARGVVTSGDAAAAPTAPDARDGGPGPRIAPALAPPATRDALMKAMLFCDQRKDFDECGRAAEALEKGTTGPADPSQAKRFRRIALTHLVQQCEAGAPHACFVLASKYRAGSDVAQNVASADALEKRGLDLCRLRTAPECPSN